MQTINSETTSEPDYSSAISASTDFDRVLLKPVNECKAFISQLSHFQKILMITDGTVTELLEHHAGESIKVNKLYEKIETNFNKVPSCHRDLVDRKDLPVLVRRILLQGKTSQENYIYASSSILINNLPYSFRKDLVSSQIPIGKLWSKHRLETYKTDFVATKEKANENLAKHLNIEVGSDVLARTYSVYSHGKKTMIITEKFSANNFMD